MTPFSTPNVSPETASNKKNTTAFESKQTATDLNLTITYEDDDTLLMTLKQLNLEKNEEL